MATEKKRTTENVKVKATEAKQGPWSIFCFVMDSKTLDNIAFVSHPDWFS